MRWVSERIKEVRNGVDMDRVVSQSTNKAD
jgi:hypothetical protein